MQDMEHSVLFSIQQTETQHNHLKENAITVFRPRGCTTLCQNI